MQLKSNVTIIERVLLISIFIFSFGISEGQQTPLSPISYWIFTPYIYNPAIVGSKDYLSIDLNTSFKGESNTQILSANTRISKSKIGYFASPEIREFSNIGFGGSIFNDLHGPFRNIGASISASYQIPLTKRKLSFLSLGASFKGVYNIPYASSIESGNTLENTFYPNVDLGIYYFDPKFFAGLSTTDLLGNPGNADSLGVFEIPVIRKYFFTAGYKILLSSSWDIVLEPSVFINVDDSTINNIPDRINPIIKLYVENFCFGTYFLTDSKISFFSQFRYPRFYIGAFFELPKDTPYYKRTPLVELTIGINIQADKSRLAKRSHW